MIAKKLGDLRALRAVGKANGSNPVSIIVPCHRVTGSDGSLIGYAGGLWRKKWLLDHEQKHEQLNLF
jgi:methylated-DNA-[protein]-cysteine S-methyltransferase